MMLPAFLRMLDRYSWKMPLIRDQLAAHDTRLLALRNYPLAESCVTWRGTAADDDLEAVLSCHPVCFGRWTSTSLNQNCARYHGKARTEPGDVRAVLRLELGPGCRAIRYADYIPDIAKYLYDRSIRAHRRMVALLRWENEVLLHPETLFEVTSDAVRRNRRTGEALRHVKLRHIAHA